MTGKRGKDKIKRCALCGGEMYEGITTIPFLIGEKVVVIKDVPAEICSDCGEAYMKSSVVDKVESVLDKLEELHSEMSVVHYEVA
jgi:YgiT-type zinc finger domain-containing protein